MPWSFTLDLVSLHRITFCIFTVLSYSLSIEISTHLPIVARQCRCKHKVFHYTSTLLLSHYTSTSLPFHCTSLPIPLPLHFFTFPVSSHLSTTTLPPCFFTITLPPYFFTITLPYSFSIAASPARQSTPHAVLHLSDLCSSIQAPPLPRPKSTKRPSTGQNRAWKTRLMAPLRPNSATQA